MSGLKISAVIPAFDAVDFLADAIESIRAQRCQVEIVVVDDGSTDQTSKLARSLGADAVFRLPDNRGPSAARNVRVQKSHGEIVGFLDADDRWTEGRRGLLLAALEAAPQAGGVIGATRFVGLVPAERAEYRFVDEGRLAVIPKLCATLLRRSVFEQVGGFDEGLTNYEDYEWFLRAVDGGIDFVTVKSPVIEYRRRGSSLSRERPNGAGDLLTMLRRSVGVRKAAVVQTTAGLAPEWGPVAAPGEGE